MTAIVKEETDQSKASRRDQAMREILKEQSRQEGLLPTERQIGTILGSSQQLRRRTKADQNNAS